MFFTPERIQQTLHTQTQAVADFNKRLFDWQLSQLALAEEQVTKQVADTMAASTKAVQASVDAATAMQAQLVGTFAPAES